MGDWLELGQAVIIGLVCSFLIAKLISVVISFKEDNHFRVASEQDLTSDALGGRGRSLLDTSNEGGGGVEESEKEKESLLGDDSDWEGIESTELDEAFSAATAFVAATAADKNSAKVSNDIQLQLYGLYKIATEGPCTVPQPSALMMTARAKWNAWKSLGAMPPEEAMEKYIIIISELYPSWANGSTNLQERNDGDSSSNVKGSMGPVFSSFVYEEESEVDLKLEPLHDFAREGEPDELLRLIANGASVNSRDSEGRTPLHWAVDRGHFDVVKILLDKNADVNARDDDGQTPLHYAALCEREEIAELLIKHHADKCIKDNDGCSPLDIRGSKWALLMSLI